MLRNRYEDDLPPPPYIYQIDDNTFNSIEDNEFIKNLRSKGYDRYREQPRFKEQEEAGGEGNIEGYMIYLM